MDDRTPFHQILSLALVLFFVVGSAALLRSSTPLSDADAPGQGLQGLGQRVTAKIDCRRLVTPKRVGETEFAQYGLADKLANGEFVAYELPGYIICNHGSLPEEGLYFYLGLSDIYYMFSKETGELAVTHLEWESDLRAATPTPPPMPTEDPNAVTVCLDAETPLVEIGEDNPGQWTIWDILGGNCAADMSGGRICFDCGDGVPWRVLVPLSADPEGEAEGADRREMACIDVTTAIALQGDDPEGDAVPVPAPDQCTLILGSGEICWSCSEVEPEPEHTAVPAEAVSAQAPAERATREPVCSDYLTPDSVGSEDWNKYDIGDKLRSGYFQRHLSPSLGSIVCYGDRAVDDVSIGGDELHFAFDINSGQLLRKRIHWRWDLPEQLPTPLISREEAEAMVEGEVNRSWLAILSPDQVLFDPRNIPYQDPCWSVSSRTVAGDLEISNVTVINAMTGEILGHYSPC
jgi:hypothetical protein